MKWQQLIRIDKVFNDPIFLLSKKNLENKFTFDVCGSTKNIYKVQIYKTNKMVYCNCPDAKGYCKYNGVICKHSCFILLKVFKLENMEEYFKSLFLNNEQIEIINKKVEELTFQENAFINMEYLEKFKNLKPDSKIEINENTETLCPICYDDLIEIENKKLNSQCHICKKIFHKKCLNTWISIGNNTCPFCRNTIKSCNSYKNLN